MSSASNSKTGGNFVTRHRSLVDIKETPEQLAKLPFPVSIPNQNFALISYVGPNTKPMCDEWAIRIYGTFGTFSEACEAADEAQECGYNYFDLDVVDIAHGFFPMPPPSDADIDVLKYKQEKLNTLLGKHKNKMMQGSEQVSGRAEGKADTRSVVEVFDKMVATEAIRLFKEWKNNGKTESKEVIKKKLKKRYEEQIEAHTLATHGAARDIATMTNSEAKVMTDEAVEGKLITAPIRVCLDVNGKIVKFEKPGKATVMVAGDPNNPDAKKAYPKTRAKKACPKTNAKKK
jgi:hypothetical protein